MRTPAGTDCPHFYGDYYRGRNKEECRLIARHNVEQPGSERWSRGLCKTCPVPKLMQANACPHLILNAKVEKKWLGLDRRVKVSAFCSKSLRAVEAPEVGCGHCHEKETVFDNLTIE